MSRIFEAKLIYSKKIAEDTVEVRFGIMIADQKFCHQPGQYLRLTLPKFLFIDSIENSRDFSILSCRREQRKQATKQKQNEDCNCEKEVAIAFRLTEPFSKFKKTLLKLPAGSPVIISGPYGNMTLPKTKERISLIFFAGGIGITAFIDKITSVCEEGLPYQLTLIWADRSQKKAAYYEVVRKYAEICPDRFRLITLFKDKGKAIKIDSAFIKKNVPNYLTAFWQIAGPTPFVKTCDVQLSKLGISDDKITCEDYIGYNLTNGKLRTRGRNIKPENELGRKRFGGFLEAINAAAMVTETDARGNITFANKQFTEISKYSQEELIGQNHRLFKSGHHTTEFYQNLWRTISSGQVWRGEINNIAKDGSYFWADTSIAPVFDNKGKIMKYVAVRFLITDRKEAEDKAHYLVSVVQSSNDAIISSNLDNIITTWNKGAENLYGYTATEAIGRNHSIILPIDCHNELAEIHEKLQKGKAVPNYETKRKHKDGSIVDVAMIVSLVLDADGEIVGLSTIAHDITEKKKFDKKKDDFLAVLSHELRNPLAAILLYTQLAQAKLKTTAGYDVLIRAELAEAIDTIKKQAGNMTSLINDLLDIGRVINNKIILHVKKTDLADCVRNAVKTSESFIRERQNTLSVSMPEQPLIVEVDPVRMEQIIVNILSNASRYSAPGKPIELTLGAGESFGEIQIKDYGRGIRKDMIGNIFNMFIQADKDSAGYNQNLGLGIGLSLIKNLVELHGGTITVQSDGPDKGSVFTVRIPLYYVSQAESKNPNTQILVVDDEKEAADGLAELLKINLPHNYIIKSTYSGDMALEMIAAGSVSPKFIMLDIAMPGKNGYEVAKIIKRDTKLTGTSLIAVSGFGQENDKLKAKEAGFDYYFTKPLANVDELLHIIQKSDNI
ncbi:MAG: PAS domain S-box protein [Candidatus Yanofskybacteria bacterium]|nr:PAS domain S-box protein [Candidatus Yanofskybacteria bacterium]